MAKHKHSCKKNMNIDNYTYYYLKKVKELVSDFNNHDINESGKTIITAIGQALASPDESQSYIQTNQTTLNKEQLFHFYRILKTGGVIVFTNEKTKRGAKKNDTNK